MTSKVMIKTFNKCKYQYKKKLIIANKYKFKRKEVTMVEKL
jgi:hypothetical protein